jgi:hypothetical protein
MGHQLHSRINIEFEAVFIFLKNAVFALNVPKMCCFVHGFKTVFDASKH